MANSWEYSLADGKLRQVSFGAGPDYDAMPDPDGMGLYFVSVRRTAALSAHSTRTRQSTDLYADSATQPVISPDGRKVAYLVPASDGSYELWASNTDGNHRIRLAGNAMTTLGMVTGRFAIRPVFCYIFCSRSLLLAREKCGLNKIRNRRAQSYTQIYGSVANQCRETGA